MPAQSSFLYFRSYNPDQGPDWRLHEEKVFSESHTSSWIETARSLTDESKLERGRGGELTQTTVLVHLCCLQLP